MRNFVTSRTSIDPILRLVSPSRSLPFAFRTCHTRRRTSIGRCCRRVLVRILDGIVDTSRYFENAFRRLQMKICHRIVLFMFSRRGHVGFCFPNYSMRLCAFVAERNFTSGRRKRTAIITLRYSWFDQTWELVEDNAVRQERGSSISPKQKNATMKKKNDWNTLIQRAKTACPRDK